MGFIGGFHWWEEAWLFTWEGSRVVFFSFLFFWFLFFLEGGQRWEGEREGEMGMENALSLCAGKRSVRGAKYGLQSLRFSLLLACF